MSWYPLYSRLGGPHNKSGQVQKILSSLGLDPWTFQSIALYWDILVQLCFIQFLKSFPLKWNPQYHNSKYLCCGYMLQWLLLMLMLTCLVSLHKAGHTCRPVHTMFMHLNITDSEFITNVESPSKETSSQCRTQLLRSAVCLMTSSEQTMNLCHTLTWSQFWVQVLNQVSPV